MGFVFMMRGGAISWSNKQKPTVILSTITAEYMESMQTTKEAIWMTKITKKLGYMKEKKVITIPYDKQGAISLMKSPTQHARRKHIDVEHHFVQEQIESGKVMFEYCSLENMVADVFMERT